MAVTRRLSGGERSRSPALCRLALRQLGLQAHMPADKAAVRLRGTPCAWRLKAG